MQVSTILNRIGTEILNPLIFLMFGVALVVFLWGGFKLIAYADDETERTTGKRSLLWGIVGMVIMVSVYGILRVVAGTFDIPLPS